MLKNRFGQQLKIEVPYNWDKSLIKEFAMPLYKSNIDFVYLCPYKDHNEGAKKYYKISHFGHNCLETQPQSWEEYVSHIEELQQHGLEVCLLLQNLCEMPSEEILMKYISLGIKVFTVTRADTANLVKRLCPEARIVGSVTRKLCIDEIISEISDLDSQFDEQVLFFPFNRGMQALREICDFRDSRACRDYHLVLLVNCRCSITCPGHHHWYATDDADAPRSRFSCLSGIDEFSIEVIPANLKYFANFIDKIKLQGREYTSDDILKDLKSYVYAISFDSNEDLKKMPEFLVGRFNSSYKYLRSRNFLEHGSIPKDRYAGFVLKDGWQASK